MLAFQEPASIERFLVITGGRVDFDYSPQNLIRTRDVSEGGDPWQSLNQYWGTNEKAHDRVYGVARYRRSFRRARKNASAFL